MSELAVEKLAVEIGEIHELFTALTTGEYDRFLEGCADDLTVVVRHDRQTAVLERGDVRGWFEQRYWASGATLCSAPSSVVTAAGRAVVVLSHALRRDGVGWQYETINLCDFDDDGLLFRWTVNPSNLLEYAQAWGLLPEVRLLPV